MRSSPPLIVLSAILAMTVTSTAAAQDTRPGWRQTPPDLNARMEVRKRQWADDLRTVLRLRPDQESALKAFLAHSGRKGPHDPDMHRPPPQAALPEGMTTPQRLDEMAQREARMASMRQRRAEKLRTFYAALSPDQQQVFDALTRMRRRGPGGDHGFRHGRGGPGDGPPRG